MFEVQDSLPKPGYWGYISFEPRSSVEYIDLNPLALTDFFVWFAIRALSYSARLAGILIDSICKKVQLEAKKAL